MKLSLVCALSNNGVIGVANRLPWHLPKELAHFKQLTKGKAILMGRRTFDSIGKPLVDRRNLILSKQKDLVIPGCEVYSSLETALNACADEAELMVIGGEHLFKQVMTLADRLILTFVDCDIAGDAYFPAWDPADWQEVSHQNFSADDKNQYAFKVVTYERC